MCLNFVIFVVFNHFETFKRLIFNLKKTNTYIRAYQSISLSLAICLVDFGSRQPTHINHTFLIFLIHHNGRNLLSPNLQTLLGMTDGFHSYFQFCLVLFNELSGFLFDWYSALMHVHRIVVFWVPYVVLGHGWLFGEKRISWWEIIGSIESLNLYAVELFLIRIHLICLFSQSLPEKGYLFIFFLHNFGIFLSHKLDKAIFFL